MEIRLLSRGPAPYVQSQYDVHYALTLHLDEIVVYEGVDSEQKSKLSILVGSGRSPKRKEKMKHSVLES